MVRDRALRCIPWVTVGALTGGGAALLGPHFDATRTILASIRILNGQCIYRDFSIPEGPVAAWILVPFLWASPSIGWALVIASAALNALAVGFAWHLVVSAGGEDAAARGAAILTSIWFLPVFDSYYLDHLAYVFVLGASAVYLSGLRPLVRGAACGLMLALAYHTKQTVGGPALAALAVSVLLVDGRRAFRDAANAWVAVFLLVGHALVLGVVGLTASLSNYYTHAVQWPLVFARENGRSPGLLLAACAYPFGIDPVEMVRAKGVGRLAFYPVVLAIYAAYAWMIRLHRHRDRDEGTRRRLLAGLMLTLSTLWCSILLGRLFTQVTFGVGALVGLITGRLHRGIRHTIVAFGALLGLLHVAAAHRPWPPLRPALPGTELRPLLIANPDGAFDIEGARGAIEYLRVREGPLALLTDSAQLIAVALARPTVEPVGDFSEGTNVPSRPDRLRRWEEGFESLLERKQVRFLLWSESEVYPHRALTPRADALRRFVGIRYVRVRSFGRYLLFERRNGDPRRPPPTLAPGSAAPRSTPP